MMAKDCTLLAGCAQQFATHQMLLCVSYSPIKAILQTDSLADQSPADFRQVGIFVSDLVLQHIFLDPSPDLVIINCRSERTEEVQWLLWEEV